MSSFLIETVSVSLWSVAVSHAPRRIGVRQVSERETVHLRLLGLRMAPI